MRIINLCLNPKFILITTIAVGVAEFYIRVFIQGGNQGRIPWELQFIFHIGVSFLFFYAIQNARNNFEITFGIVLAYIYMIIRLCFFYAAFACTFYGLERFLGGRCY